MGKTIGYIRVSTIDQNTDRQLDGIKCDRTFIDKVSGKDTNRPALQELLSFIREDDTLLVHSQDRLARNLVDLRNIVNDLVTKGITVKFIKENLTFTNQDDPIAIMMLSQLGGFAEFERTWSKIRQREGIELAKAKGIYKGRTPKLSQEQIIELNNKINLGIPKAKIAKEFGVSRYTLYKYLNKQ